MSKRISRQGYKGRYRQAIEEILEDNRRVKIKIKGLLPASHRQQALSAA